jgi:hypothetical protein
VEVPAAVVVVTPVGVAHRAAVDRVEEAEVAEDAATN